ncbi:MAG: hypothetical protein K2Q45_06985 [Nitrosomonas sp.]|nr:hypothetical protein [Nitrosomonas sp.]
MHSLSPYILRCFNPNLSGKLEERYSVLDKVGQSDAFQLLETFIQSHSNDFFDIEDTKQVFRFSQFTFSQARRVAYGWLESGSYGIRSDIINVETGKVDFKKAQNNAEIIKHFVYFFMPRGFNEAIALLHAYRGGGIKTLFFGQFSPYFSEQTQLNLQMNPLSYDKAFDRWVDGQAKEMRLVKFTGFTYLANQIKHSGHDEQELRLKPPRKGALGKFKDFLNPSSEQAKAVELLTPLCAQVKTVIELDGKKRVFQVGASADHAVCEIEAPEELPLEGGNPTFDGMTGWCKEVAQEFSLKMYPGMQVQP